MSITKTLGGDRLGSGKKMQQTMHGFERSTHDKGYLFRTSMAAGTLVPFIDELALPGDTWDIDLNCDIKTHPAAGPLFGSYKVQLDVFLAPIRLYQGQLHNNELNIGRNMQNVFLPQIELTATELPDGTTLGDDIDNAQTNPSSLLAYLGIRGVGLAPAGTKRQFCAINILMYWDTYKNYYANKSEDIGAVIHTPAVALINTVDTINVVHVDTTSQLLNFYPATSSIVLGAGDRFEIAFTGTNPLPEQIVVRTLEHGDLTIKQLCGGISAANPAIGYFNATMWGPTTILYWRYIDVTDNNNGKPAIATFPLTYLDDMRTKIIQHPNPIVPFLINDLNKQPYMWLYEQPTGIPNVLSSQEGLGLKTYQSDLFNNWLKSEWIDDINTRTSIDVTSGSFSIESLNLANKFYNLLNRITTAGGSYDDYQDAAWAHDRYKQCTTPMYIGGLIKELIFQEVISNSATEDQPLGQLAGRGVMAAKHKGGKVIIKVDEPSWILGIISITPRIDNSQGNKWTTGLKTMADLHTPMLDQIGYQDLIEEQMAWWTTEYNAGLAVWEQKSAGKQPAWMNYMTNVNVVRGNFAYQNNEMFMTLNRRYEYGAAGIADLTTYIDPSKFNYIFAEQQLDAQNFWTQIAVDITYRGKISAKQIPNL